MSTVKSHHGSNAFSHLRSLRSADQAGVDPHEQRQREDLFVMQTYKRCCFVTSLQRVWVKWSTVCYTSFMQGLKPHENYLPIGQMEYSVMYWTNQRGCKKKCCHVQLCDAQLSNPYSNWLKKCIFHGINQSEMCVTRPVVVRGSNVYCQMC